VTRDLNSGLHACKACSLSLETYFGLEMGSQTICPGWPQTVILLISASQVARSTGVSHWLAISS
jgi:hypothetical protein